MSAELVTIWPCGLICGLAMSFTDWLFMGVQFHRNYMRLGGQSWRQGRHQLTNPDGDREVSGADLVGGAVAAHRCAWPTTCP